MQTNLKQAEAAVIRAARHLADTRRHTNHPLALSDRMSAVCDAVMHLDAVQLSTDMTTEGAVGNNAPDTSKNAARVITPTTGVIRHAVLNELRLFQGTDMIGLTCDQLEQRLRRPHTSVSSAVNWLMENGWIEDSGYRRNTRADRPAIIWRLTPAATDHYRNGQS